MSSELPSGLDPELLNDYFSEADQHLIAIRQALVQLGGWIGRLQPEPKILEELFQNMHSFKGISAIAGLQPAEAVAHAAEDCLRKMTQSEGLLTEEMVDVLMSAAQKLEEMVVAFRLGKPAPAHGTLLADLRRNCEQWSAAGAAQPQRGLVDLALSQKIEAAKQQGELLWAYKFVPSPELEAQGIKLDLIREQLPRAGTILNTSPVVDSSGALSFEFLVAAKEPPADIAAWEARGVSVQLAELKASQKQPQSSTRVPVHDDAEHTPFLAPSHRIRVDLNRLDELMRIAGEMVIYRSRLETQLARLSVSAGRPDLRGLHEVNSGLGRSLKELREAIMRVRLVRVAEIFERMPYVVRDLSRQSHKKVRLKLEGQDTAIDKYVIERLKDPLLHLVRNAFTHGIESPEERMKSGKSEEATIELKASAEGDSVLIQVRDDGRGINSAAIVERARKLGLQIPKVVNKEAILTILCASGFSTQEAADRASGRGIGMGVVYATVRELGGTLTLESEEGKGAQFTLRLPLTLAIAESLIVRAAGQTCAMPQSFVTEILHITERQIQKANGIEIIPYRVGVLPIVRLAGLFQKLGEVKPKMFVLVITCERGSVGLLTEEVLGRREVVVQAMPDPLIQVRGVSGATELGDGKPVLILDATALTGGSVRPPEKPTLVGGMN